MKFLVHIIIFSFLFSFYSQLSVCINYLINQKYYAEVLCVNKDKQNSCCKGKCAMEKELVSLSENESDKNSKAPILKLDKISEFIFKTHSGLSNSLDNKQVISEKKYNTLIGINFKVKKPPIC